ncbi:hypothetical protein [Rhodococcus opacus]|nr:hypothetical protein [Rhodococcus opacus]
MRILMREGLVEALRLLIEPVMLGGRKKIFPETVKPYDLIGRCSELE